MKTKIFSGTFATIVTLGSLMYGYRIFRIVIESQNSDLRWFEAPFYIFFVLWLMLMMILTTWKVIEWATNSKPMKGK